jgi:hypothetical protein
MTDDADDSDVSEQHAKEFFEAYGRAMLGWQYVEAELFLIFSSLIRGKDHHVVSAAYHAVVNLNSKLDMITEAIQVAFPETLLFSEWEKLRKKIQTSARNRNKLAHYMLLGHLPKQADGLVTLRLAPSLHDARHKSRAELDTKRIAAWDESFNELSHKIDAFGKELTAALSP